MSLSDSQRADVLAALDSNRFSTINRIVMAVGDRALSGEPEWEMALTLPKDRWALTQRRLRGASTIGRLGNCLTSRRTPNVEVLALIDEMVRCGIAGADAVAEIARTIVPPEEP